MCRGSLAGRYPCRGLPHRRGAVRAQSVADRPYPGLSRLGDADAGGKAGSGPRARADHRLSRPAGGAGGGGAEDRLHLPRFPVQPGRPVAAPRRQPGDGADRRAGHRSVPDRLHGGGEGREAPAHLRQPHRDRQRPRPRRVPPRPGGAPAGARGARHPGRPGGDRRGFPPGARQGLSGAGRGDARRAGRGIMGGGRTAGLGPRRRHGGLAAGSRARRPVEAARLSPRCGGGAGGGGHLHLAELFRSPADVGDRGDAFRVGGGCERYQRAERTGRGGRHRPAGPAASAGRAGGGAGPAGRGCGFARPHGGGGKGAGAGSL